MCKVDLSVGTMYVQNCPFYCSYLESPWLCNLDWSAKVFRGKALKTKKEREQLLKRIEEQRKEEEEQERGDKFEFVISSTDISSLKQLVHMPGYPE